MWELKAIGLLLLAAALLARFFNIIDSSLWNAIFLAVFNYFMLNASGSKLKELEAKLIEKKQDVSILSVDWKIKVAFVGIGIIAAIAYYLKLIDYDLVTKVLQAVAVILMANLGWTEYKLYKLSR
jgi:hypothetical protein